MSKINVQFLKETNGKENGSFLVNDILGTLKMLNLNNITIVNITGYSGEKEEIEESINNLLKSCSNNDLICTTAYISKEEYPEDKYCLDDDPNKEKIDIDKALLPYVELFDRLGFTNTNFYTGYEYKVSFIYPNEVGKKVIDTWIELNI